MNATHFGMEVSDGVAVVTLTGAGAASATACDLRLGTPRAKVAFLYSLAVSLASGPNVD